MKEIRQVRHRRSRASHRVGKLARELHSVHGRVWLPELIRRSEKTDDASQDPEPGAIDQELYELAPLGFYTLDRAGRICELNERGAKLLGFAAEWLIGKSFVVFIARQHVQPFLNFLRQLRNGTRTRTIDVDLYVSNRTLPVQISMTRVREGGSELHRLTVVDMTDFRNTEELLQESFSNWYSLVHSAPDTIMIVEARGRICFVNKPTWGYSSNALLGTNLLDHIPKGHHGKVLGCLAQSFGRNRPTACDVTGLSGNHSQWFNLSFGSPHVVMLSGTDGLRTRALTTTVMIREVSEAKRKEATLRTSEGQLRDFAARLEAVREEERTRVAREIHDELGQALTALKLDLSWVHSKSKASRTIRRKMKSMIQHVDRTIDCVRRISSELRPAILDDLGFIPAIEWQVSEFRKRTGIRTRLISQANGLNLSSDDSVAVFRVVQEALTNIMRHAKATRVCVSLKREMGGLKITITDNGRGMTPNEKTDLKSTGIVGMKGRIFRLGGEFNIFSEPGKGTRLDIIIPTLND
jgi:PAS domain S-box-containing protein